jgi:predicted aconitase
MPPCALLYLMDSTDTVSPSLYLTAHEQRLLSGGAGEAARLAMSIIVRLATVTGAEQLVEITSAHIDGCLYHGQAGLDFAKRVLAGGGHVVVPTTLNVSSLDLLHPTLYRGNGETARQARRLMEAYRSMGCRPTWTCAPYQLPARPRLGEHIGWAESNAIVFANSVLGARTERYGDFTDICAAITGRVPYVGLHRTEQRAGKVVYDVRDVPARLLREDVFYPIAGHLVGADVGDAIPVIDGLPTVVTEDRLKALGAAAASSGAVAMFHAVGVTPEAPTLQTALQGRSPERTVRLSAEQAIAARDALTTARGTNLGAVSLGTPHFSVTEFAELAHLLHGVRVHQGIDFYVSTGRDTLGEARERGYIAPIERAGVTLVTDTCTYITPIIRPVSGAVMTNSAKWAYYAPGNIGVEVVFGSMRECVESACRGEVWRDSELWMAR